jgi:uncharacterized protein YcbK (DUF882 family)
VLLKGLLSGFSTISIGSREVAWRWPVINCDNTALLRQGWASSSWNGCPAGPAFDSWHQPMRFKLQRMDRRSFINALAGGVVAQLLTPHALGQSQDFWSQPRTLSLYRKQSNEYVKATYFADGRIIDSEYKRLCILLRDVNAGQAVHMSIVLLDILAGIQGWLLANGIDSALHTNSGYRTPQNNANLEGAAKNSKHINGEAWDGRVPGVTTESMGRFAVYLQGGGVGVYQDRGFIHVDSGGRRFWRG